MQEIFKKITGIRHFIVSRNIGKYRSRIFRGYVLIALISFAVLAFLALHLPYFPVDLVISQDVQKFSPLWFDALMKFVSLPGNSINMVIVVATAVVLLLINKLKWETVCVILNSLGYFVLEYFFKHLIHRSRPAEDLVKVFLPLKDYSFPSGHVLSYTAFFGFLAFLTYTHLARSKQRTIIISIFLILVILVSVSRVYLGEHWPSDTLGSYLLGSAVLLTTIEIYIWGRPKFFKKDPTIKPAVSSHIQS